MSRRHKKKKPSRKARQGQPRVDRSATPASSGAPQSPEAAPAGTPQPQRAPGQPAPAPRPAVTATFTPGAAPATGRTATPGAPVSAQAPAAPQTDTEREYESVRQDLGKVGLTIVAFIVIIAGLVILNDQTNFVGHLGHYLFRFWQ